MPPQPPEATSAPDSVGEARGGELDAMASRLPPGRPLSLGVDSAALLVANGIALRYLLIGEMTPLELVVLVAVEALMLSGLARFHRVLVPKAARIRSPESGHNPVATLFSGLAWLAVVYYAVFWMYFGAEGEVVAALGDPLGLLWQPQIRWPLLITAAGALIDALSDQAHFRERGGPFVSTVELNGLARWLTLFLGAIPFLVPLLGLGFGVAFLVKRLESTHLAPGSTRLVAGSAWLALLLAALAAGMAAVIGGLLVAGVSGWAIGFVSAKLVSEALVVALPTIAARIHREETASTGSSGRRPQASF